MAEPRVRKGKLPKLRYFFYNGELHRKIHINRSDDTIVAWNYPKHQTARYIYSDVRKKGEKAFSTKQVCEMIGRQQRTVKNAINEGMVRRPQIAYNLENPDGWHAYYWREKDIMELHDYLSTVHKGRPRKDGFITPMKNLPSKAELRAMIRQEKVFYVKVGDEFVPSWQAERF